MNGLNMNRLKTQEEVINFLLALYDRKILNKQEVLKRISLNKFSEINQNSLLSLFDRKIIDKQEVLKRINI